MIEYNEGDNLSIKFALSEDFLKKEMEPLKRNTASIRRVLENMIVANKDKLEIELFDTNSICAQIIQEALTKLGVKCDIESDDQWARFKLDISNSSICNSIKETLNEYLYEDEEDME